MSERSKIGIFGGSFDPPHEAHLEMARKAMTHMELDRIVFVPCYQNPFKDFIGHASPFHRYVMTQLATLVENTMMVTPLEINRKGVSYTIDTLKAISKPQCRLSLIMGLDAFITISDWKDSHMYPEYLESILVFQREEDEGKISDVPENIVKISNFISGFDMNVSSTEIRKKIRGGENIAGLVSPMVRVYIKKYELYMHFRDQKKLIDEPVKEFFIKDTDLI